MYAAGVLGRYFGVSLYTSKGDLDRTHDVFLNLLASALPEEKTRTYFVNMLVYALSRTKVFTTSNRVDPHDDSRYAYASQVVKTPGHVIAVAFGLSVFRRELQIPFEFCQLEMSEVLTLIRRLDDNDNLLMFDKDNDDILGRCKQWL